MLQAPKIDGFPAPQATPGSRADRANLLPRHSLAEALPMRKEELEQAVHGKQQCMD